MLRPIGAGPSGIQYVSVSREPSPLVFWPRGDLQITRPLRDPQGQRSSLRDPRGGPSTAGARANAINRAAAADEEVSLSESISGHVVVLPDQESKDTSPFSPAYMPQYSRTAGTTGVVPGTRHQQEQGLVQQDANRSSLGNEQVENLMIPPKMNAIPPAPTAPKDQRLPAQQAAPPAGTFQEPKSAASAGNEEASSAASSQTVDEASFQANAQRVTNILSSPEQLTRDQRREISGSLGEILAKTDANRRQFSGDEQGSAGGVVLVVPKQKSSSSKVVPPAGKGGGSAKPHPAAKSLSSAKAPSTKAPSAKAPLAKRGAPSPAREGSHLAVTPVDEVEEELVGAVSGKASVSARRAAARKKEVARKKEARKMDGIHLPVPPPLIHHEIEIEDHHEHYEEAPRYLNVFQEAALAQEKAKAVLAQEKALMKKAGNAKAKAKLSVAKAKRSS